MAIVLQIRKAGSPFQQNSLHFAADLSRGDWVCHCHLAFYELLTECEAWERPCMHSSKLVFLLSARSPIPLSKLCWCQRMWSHCPGKTLGGVGGEAGPPSLAKLCVRRVSVTSVLLSAPKVLPGTHLWIKYELQSENMQNWLEKNFLWKNCFHSCRGA